MDNVKILVIGNNEVNLKVIKGRLLEFDEDWFIYNMLCEESHNEINQYVYELIILDCSESSIELINKIEEIKNSEKNFNTPILVSINESPTEYIEKVLQAGALDFIQKPFKSIELFARVRTALTLSSSINKLQNQNRIINDHQQKLESVLNGIVPHEIISEITEYGESKPKKYRDATVMFVDLVDFTKKSRTLTPKIIINEISEIFKEFDKIVALHQCTRIKTMGDGYLAVSGIPTPNNKHVANMIKSALAMREFLFQRNRINSVKWDVKIGINSGEVIGSVLGQNNFFFDVFGDTVNEASRMEQACEPNQINISEAAFIRSRHEYRFIERLPHDIKGIGKTKMFYLKSELNTTGFSTTRIKNNLKFGNHIIKLSINQD